MKLTIRCRYAMRALTEIALNYQKRLTKRKELILNEKISDSYLEDLLIAMKKSGLLETVRGKNGGYSLTRPPKEITLLDIITSQEGSLAPMQCLLHAEQCEHVDFCDTREIMDVYYQVIIKGLKSVTLQDMVGVTTWKAKKLGSKVRKYC